MMMLRQLYIPLVTHEGVDIYVHADLDLRPELILPEQRRTADVIRTERGLPGSRFTSCSLVRLPLLLLLLFFLLPSLFSGLPAHLARRLVAHHVAVARAVPHPQVRCPLGASDHRTAAAEDFDRIEWQIMT